MTILHINSIEYRVANISGRILNNTLREYVLCYTLTDTHISRFSSQK